MYSIIQAFGINYAENSSIIKQIKKPETGDTAGSPSEGMDSVGRAWTRQRDQKGREGGDFAQERTEAQKRPRPAGSKGLRLLSLPLPAFLTTLGGIFPPHQNPAAPARQPVSPGALTARNSHPSKGRGVHPAVSSVWSRKAGARTRLSWSRQQCEGAGTQLKLLAAKGTVNQAWHW